MRNAKTIVDIPSADLRSATREDKFFYRSDYDLTGEMHRPDASF